MSKADSAKIIKKEYHPHSLKRWINIFFMIFILAIISFSILLYFYLDILKTSDYTSFFTSHFKYTHDNIFEKVIFVQKALIGFAFFTLIGLGVVWTYLSYWIISPLVQMTDTAEQIGLGKLNHTISRVRAPAEIQRISETIDDFSVNFQEVLLFVWNQAEASLRCIEEYKQNEQDSPHIEVFRIDSIKKNMHDLQKLVSTFAFYDVHLENKKMYDASQKLKTS